MDSFNGIPIAEYRLLVSNIVFSILAIIAVGLIAVMIWIMRSGFKHENKEHISKLREKAQTSNIAAKRLKKIERRIKRERKENRPDFIIACIIMVVCIVVGVVSSVFGAIPGWIDYAHKDYVVYNGSFEVHRSGRNNWIELSDGTKLEGHGGFYWDDTSGTVVYAKRSKITIGGISKKAE